MIKKIRVMHVAQCAGGVERYIQMLLKRINTNRFENILVVSADYDIAKYEEIAYAVEQVDISREINAKMDIKAIISVRRMIKKYNPDIVYAHSSKAGAVGRIANLGLKSKCIYNPHGWAFNMRGCSQKKIAAYRLIEKILSHFCTNIIAISKHEKDSAIKNNICKEEKIQVIYNGIDIDGYLKLENKDLKELIKSQCKIPEDSFVIGCVGRLSAQKAPDIFIKAAHLIKKEINEAYFLLVGDGEQRKETEKLINELGLGECVYITGWVDNPMDYIEQFDIAMLLSRWEGFGLVLTEYMLAEKPIVATRVDAIPEIVLNNVNGILVDSDDILAVRNAILKLYLDRELRKTLIDNGRQIVKKNFALDRVLSSHETLFYTMINRG